MPGHRECSAQSALSARAVGARCPSRRGTQTVVLLTQLGEAYLERLAVGVLHVIDEKGREVAGYDPPRALAVGQGGTEALCLLEGGEQCAVALLDGRAQVLVERLLLNHGVGALDVVVDKGRVFELHLVLKRDDRRGLMDAEQLGQEQLAFPFFIALARPALCNVLSGEGDLFLVLAHR